MLLNKMQLFFSLSFSLFKSRENFFFLIPKYLPMTMVYMKLLWKFDALKKIYIEREMAYGNLFNLQGFVLR